MFIVDIAGALVSPRMSTPRLLDCLRGRGIAADQFLLSYTTNCLSNALGIHSNTINSSLRCGAPEGSREDYFSANFELTPGE